MKRFILVLVLILSASGLFAEENLKGQIFSFNEEANEEIVIINNSPRQEAFKIYVHTKNATTFNFNGFAVDYTSTEEGWQFITKTPIIKCREKWKSSSDFKILALSDYICIESKSGFKYNYTFETKHDKLNITVTAYKESDDW